MGGWIIFAGTRTKLYRFEYGGWVEYRKVSGGNYNVPEGGV